LQSGDFETLYSYVDEDAGEIRLVATNSGSGITGDVRYLGMFLAGNPAYSPLYP